VAHRKCSRCKCELTEATATASIIAKGGYCRSCVKGWWWENKQAPIHGPAFPNGVCRNCHSPLKPKASGGGWKLCQECCRDCGSPTLTWWDGRGYERCPAAFTRCEDCYLAYARNLYAKRKSDGKRFRKPTPEEFGTVYGLPTSPTRCDLARCEWCEAPCRNMSHSVRMSLCGPCRQRYESELGDRAELRRRRQIAEGDPTINWRALGERDGWKCHICGGIVRRVAGTAKRPLGATVDHLIPIADNGSHVWSNVALAHRSCNSSRGAGGAAQLRLVG
jgi:hypothetical protein